MEVKLQLSVFVLLIQVSLAVWQRVTVRKGQTLSLSCPITDAHINHVDWRNPEGYVMFFNNQEVLKDKRYSINKLSLSEFTISISDITFKDGGIYTCSQYDAHTTEKKVEVTVLGRPKMEVAKNEGTFVIKCTAEGNHYPPQISWKLDNGPEIIAHGQEEVRKYDDKKYVTMEMLQVRSVENRITVKCLVRHPALYSRPLMNFVQIGPDSTKPWGTTTTSSPSTQPRGSTEVPGTTTVFKHGRTTVYLATRGSKGPSSESSITTVTAPSGRPLVPVKSTGSHLSTDGLQDWTSVSETTEDITSNNRTQNQTGSFNDSKMRTGTGGSSSLLVFLVTCLIFGLLVVVIFFAFKLRRAHIAWKRENEDTDPSEESSKSKSSQEERNAQGQRRRGLFNTAFTKYVVEKPAAISSVINTNAMAAAEIDKDQPSQPQTLQPSVT